MGKLTLIKIFITSLTSMMFVFLEGVLVKKHVPQFGVMTKFENIDLVKAASGDFIGISVGDWLDPNMSEEAFTALQEKAKSSLLPITLANGFIRPKHLKATGPDINHDELLTYIEVVFQRAQKSGIKMINFGSSGARNIPDGFDKELAFTQFTDLLKRIGPLAAKYNLTVGVEQLRKQECNFINTLAEVARVVRGANHPNIKAVADFYHMVVEGDTPKDLAKVTDILMHVEIAEEKDRRIPGTTDQDFRPFFKVLKKAKYKGAIGIEAKFEMSELAKGFATLRSQWMKA
jgi:sugar phosphate isomerase/epimerase